MKPKFVACPICSQPSLFDPTNAYRPFCSKRCKLIDLGEWASDSYRVPLNEAPEADQIPTESKSES